MKVSILKNNPNNPRVIKDDKLKKLIKSIQDFPEMMEKRPMVCVTDTDGKIFPLGGNMRLRAIREIGMKEIPDSWVQMADEWTEDQRLEFVIKDNVSFGDWNLDVISKDWNTDILTGWGLDISFEDMTTDDMDSKYNNSNCEYPLIPIFDEKYTAYIIICESETEEANIRTKFNFPDKAKSYKNSFLGKTNILRAKEII